MTRVSLTRGRESYKTVKKALDLIKADVKPPKPGQEVLIKPNLVVDTDPLVATPVDAVRATMDFLQEMGVKKFVVGEGTAGEVGNTMGAFEKFGYFELKKEYDVEFRDLNKDEHLVFEAFDANMTPVRIRVDKSYFSTYIVSVARMKTHLQAIVTLTIKNLAIGCIHNPDRHSLAWHKPGLGKFSHDPKPINIYLARFGHALNPSIAVVDGVVGMEGNGPVRGTPINSGMALAGTEATAVDIIGSEVMGFDYRTIGYLWYLSEVKKLPREAIEVVGEEPRRCMVKFKPYEKLQAILPWYVENWKELLNGNYFR